MSLHGHACAVIARHFAKRSAPPLIEVAFTAGLLHNIGRLGLAVLRADSFLSKGSPSNEPTKSPGLKHDFSESDHNQVAEIVLRAWEIPEQITRAVVLSGQPIKAPSEMSALANLIQLACGMSSLIGITDACSDVISRNALAETGLSDELESILPGVFGEVGKAGVFKRNGI